MGNEANDALVLTPNAEAWEKLVASVTELETQLAQSQAPQAAPQTPFNPNAAMGADGVQQMMQNPNMMSQMGPMLQQVAQNPQLLQQAMQNPMLQQMAAGNPMLQQMMSNPAMLQNMLSNPMAQQFLQNPSAMQQAMQGGGGMGGMGGGMGGMPAAAPAHVTPVANNPAAPAGAQP